VLHSNDEHGIAPCKSEDAEHKLEFVSFSGHADGVFALDILNLFSILSSGLTLTVVPLDIITAFNLSDGVCNSVLHLGN